MKNVRYEIKLKGNKIPSGSISFDVLINVLNAIKSGSEKSLRLIIEGISSIKGKKPTWLLEAVNFNFTGLRKGSTILEFEAPTFEETLLKHPLQLSTSYNPQPTDTAVSIFVKAFDDADKHNKDSEFYDNTVLDSIIDFKNALEFGDNLELSSENERDHFKLDKNELKKIAVLKKSFPESKMVVLSGILDLIAGRRKAFKLILEGDEIIPGIIDTTFIGLENLRKHWNSKVTVKGMLNFKPSGKPRSIEVQLIKALESGEELFSKIQNFEQSVLEQAKELKKNYNAEQTLKQIWGKWPGNESLEEILEDLEEIS